MVHKRPPDIYTARQVHLAFCLLEKVGPCKDSRAFSRYDFGSFACMCRYVLFTRTPSRFCMTSDSDQSCYTTPRGRPCEKAATVSLRLGTHKKKTISWPQKKTIRALPACQHRPVLHPLRIPTHAINQTLPRCYYQSELFSQIMWAKRLVLLTTTNDRLLSKRFPISDNFLLTSRFQKRNQLCLLSRIVTYIFFSCFSQNKYNTRFTTPLRCFSHDSWLFSLVRLGMSLARKIVPSPPSPPTPSHATTYTHTRFLTMCQSRLWFPANAFPSD